MELFAYTIGYIKNKNSFLYRINGVENHLHLLCGLYLSITLADFMRDMKASTSIWLRQSGKFPEFKGWAEGYAALTYIPGRIKTGLLLILKINRSTTKMFRLK